MTTNGAHIDTYMNYDTKKLNLTSFKTTSKSFYQQRLFKYDNLKCVQSFPMTLHLILRSTVVSSSRGLK